MTIKEKIEIKKAKITEYQTKIEVLQKKIQDETTAIKTLETTEIQNAP